MHAATSEPPHERPRLVNGLPREIGILVGSREHLSCTEVARLFSCSPMHVVNLCQEGAIKARRNKSQGPRSLGAWTVPVPALREFIRRKTLCPFPE